MNYISGDIVLVKFPYTNLINYKKRPVLVIKSLKKYNDVICFQITTNKFQDNIIYINEYLIKPLKIDSYVKYDKCFTVSSDIIIKKISEVNKKFLDILKEKFCSFSFI